MVMVLWSPLRRWWQAAFAAPAPAAVQPLRFRRPATRSSAHKTGGARPLTPFGATTSTGRVAVAQRAARRFWMTLDPEDQRRAAIGGSFAEVCAALERLAAVEEGQRC